ncbi:DJ-1/PfpI family protein [Halorussus salinisoli]|uniref:DJ-1/PfpI family protein n=1 Tax=Halorussus salinisoli TaxID=2558242 RepID=UPI0010C226F6|nr:DJ-1/PfpI family protein [Halorussus salinisoli]
MRIAFVIYDGMTTLDFIGAYDSLVRLQTMGFLPDLEWDVCAQTEEIQDGTELAIGASQVGQSLADYDLLYVPGARRPPLDTEFIDWIRTAAPVEGKVSVCTGALILGEAGFLEGKQATTHPMAFDDLRRYCTVVEDRRIVTDGNVTTARGVTASIDLGLYLCEELAGKDAKEQIQSQMDYPHETCSAVD